MWEGSARPQAITAIIAGTTTTTITIAAIIPGDSIGGEAVPRDVVPGEEDGVVGTANT